MFLRKKPNKSGSTSVQVIVKTKNRKQRVVKTIGSSRDTDEIERLMAEGRKYISNQNGPLFPALVSCKLSVFSVAQIIQEAVYLTNVI